MDSFSQAARFESGAKDRIEECPHVGLSEEVGEVT
jgi:hypothetical protein